MAAHITDTDDQKKTVSSDLRRTDGTTSNGTIETIVESSGAGESARVTLRTSGGVYSLEDSASCAELTELAQDMIAHWTRVAAKIAAVAAALAPAEEPEG
jgi:hypothetical protein